MFDRGAGSLRVRPAIADLPRFAWLALFLRPLAALSVQLLRRRYCRSGCECCQGCQCGTERRNRKRRRTRKGRQARQGQRRRCDVWQRRGDVWQSRAYSSAHRGPHECGERGQQERCGGWNYSASRRGNRRRSAHHNVARFGNRRRRGLRHRQRLADNARLRDDLRAADRHRPGPAFRDRGRRHSAGNCARSRRPQRSTLHANARTRAPTRTGPRGGRGQRNGWHVRRAEWSVLRFDAQRAPAARLTRVEQRADTDADDARENRTEHRHRNAARQTIRDGPATG